MEDLILVFKKMKKNLMNPKTSSKSNTKDVNSKLRELEDDGLVHREFIQLFHQRLNIHLQLMDRV